MKASLSVLLWSSASCAALACSASLHAAETNSPVGHSKSHGVKRITEEVITWGTQVTSSSVYMGAEDFGIRQADHLSDLLRTIPGVDVGGAHSLNQRITIRSMDDKDLRITIDGANQNTYMYHHMGNLQIHADILQSVDIEIGTNSVVNGGIGGAVRFQTKSADQLLKPGQRFGAMAQISYADNSGNSGSFSSYGKLSNKLDFLAYHNHVARDNYAVGGGDIKDQDGVTIPNTDGEVRGLEGDVEDSLIKLGWDFDASQRIELSYERYIDEGDYSYRPDMGLATDLSIGDALDTPLLWPTEFTRDTLTLNYDVTFGQTQLTLALYDNHSALKRDETGFRSSTALVRGQAVSDWAAQIDGEADNRGLNALAQTRWNTAWAAQTLTYGVEYTDYSTEYRAAYLNGNVDSSSEEATTTSLFLQDRIQLNEQWALIPGIRYDDYALDSALVDDSFDGVTAAIAAEYAPNNTLLFKLSTTQLFKAPEIGEVFIGAGLFDTANPSINEETGLNSEFSVAYGDTLLGADRFAMGLTVFETAISDYIYDYAPAPLSTGARSWKDNIGDMTINGVEAYASYRLGTFEALLTFANAESELDAFESYVSLDGARIDRQQGDSISLTVDYVIEALNLTLHWDVLKVDDVSADLDLDGATLDNAKDGYTVHNISARWTPEAIKGLAVTMGIDNLTDEFYASQSSRTGTSFHPLFGNLYLLDYEPGRNYKMSLSFSF